MIKTLTKAKWIIDYIQDPKTICNEVDVLNSDFVDAYIDEFKPKINYVAYGAQKVPELGRLLSLMYKKNIFYRKTVSLEGMPWGFPKWVYSYFIRGNNYKYMDFKKRRR